MNETDLIAEDLRAAWRRRPSGVCVLSARDQGMDLAATVTDVISVSLHPPMILASLHAHSRIREALDVGEPWALSLLDGSPAAIAAARQLAEPGRPLIGQLTGVEHRRGEASGAALIEASSAWIECRTEWIKGAGDHDLVVAQVLAVHLSPAVPGALIHHLGRISPTV